MSKIDNVTKDLGQTDRPLRDDELESVNGGIIIDWRPEICVSITPLPAGSDRMLNFS